MFVPRQFKWEPIKTFLDLAQESIGARGYGVVLFAGLEKQKWNLQDFQSFQNCLYHKKRVFYYYYVLIL